MTQDQPLHERLVAALQARLEVARAATPGPWVVRETDGRSIEGGGDLVVAGVAARKLWPSREDAAFIAANDPATEIRRVEALLRVVQRHVPEPGQHPDFCGLDRHELPCPDMRDIAAGEGIEP